MERAQLRCLSLASSGQKHAQQPDEATKTDSYPACLMAWVILHANNCAMQMLCLLLAQVSKLLFSTLAISPLSRSAEASAGKFPL